MLVMFTTITTMERASMRDEDDGTYVIGTQA
jgi:hypothetical protein